MASVATTPISYQQDYDAALHADRCGFDEVFVGEHYSARVEPISNTLQFMSALIPTAKNITFGTGVLNLPHHHPAKIAADVALFDHMSRGRLIMGIGPAGYRPISSCLGPSRRIARR